MKREGHFNPVIETVVTIRQLAIASSENWTAMKKASFVISDKISEASTLINNNASSDSLEEWKTIIHNYEDNLTHLKSIMNDAVSRIKKKTANHISQNWENYHQYVKNINSHYETLESIGEDVLPQNKNSLWKQLWSEIYDLHLKIPENIKPLILRKFTAK